MAKYYKLDSRKVTFAEYWNTTRSPVVILPWLAKLFGIPLPLGGEMPFIESLAEFRTPETDIAPLTLGKMKPIIAELEQLGFHSPIYYRFESGPTQVAFVDLIEPSGTTVVRVMFAYNGGKENQLVVLMSEFADATYLVTSDGKKTLDPPPQVTVQRMVKARLPRLWEAHQIAVSEWRSRKPIRLYRTAEEAEQSGARYEKSCMEYAISIGRYVPLSEEDNTRLEAKANAVQVAKESGVQNAEILAELNQSNEKKRGWGNAILILVVSMAVFVGAGASQWSWKTTLILIPILLFHELGHYLAMRIFKYRNLRMFFIPFFGAAVTGQNYNVPGWKKVIVSLMGPMPGIFAGAGLGFAGIVLHQPWMVQGAIMALILNGFNLLPFLPLDGGWVCHSLVFCRHYILDTAFRLIAVLALLAAGAFMDTKVFLFLGIIMAMGLPVTYRVARIAADLKKRELPHASEDDQTIPVDTAQAIITEVKSAFPKNVTTKMIAQHTLNIFETLNARPPGWAATIGLFFVYMLNFAVVLAVAAVLLFGQSGGRISTLLAGLRSQPTCKYVHGSLLSWRGEKSGESFEKGKNTIVATFKRPTDATKAFSNLTNAAPAEAAMELFGSTALITIPVDLDSLRKRYLDQLRAQTKDVFVMGTNSHASISLVCVAPDKEVARAIYEEANQYFQASGMNLIAPWSPEDGRSAAEKQQHRIARQTFERIQEISMAVMTNHALETFTKRIMRARNEADQPEVEKVQAEQTRFIADTRARLLEELRKEGPDKVDLKVIDLQKDLMARDEDESSERKDYQEKIKELAVRMGPLPSEDRKLKRFSTMWGQVSQTGMSIRFDMISFEDLFEGAPVLADWLGAKGCTKFKYSIHGGISDFD